MKRSRKRKARKGVPPLRVHREQKQTAKNGEDAQQPNLPEGANTEEFWAGRNHAMRKSARVAA